MQDFHTPSHFTIKLAQSPLGSGGEGHIYEIISPVQYSGLVAKIFHPKERTALRHKKIQYLIANRPSLQTESLMIWPEEVLLSENNFVGYLMPKASGPFDLTVLSALKFSRKLNREWQTQFSRNTAKGLHNRIRIAYQLAFAVYQLHETGRYVIVDLKPENIRVNLDTSIEILDNDSVQVMEDGKLLYPAEKLSGEYSPAELKVLDRGHDLIPETWDSFSMAVVMYKLILGLHPYTSTPGPAYENLNALDQKIQAGLFPFGKQAEHLQIIPELHKGLDHLPEALRKLFYQSFVEGYENPDLRPSAWEWTRALSSVKLHELTPLEAYNASRKSRLRTKSRENSTYAKDQKDQPRGIPAWIYILFISFALSNGYFIWLGAYYTPKSEFLPLQQATPEKWVKFEEAGKVGFANQMGNVVIPSVYDQADDFQGEYARVFAHGKFGYINRLGEELIPCIYDSLEEVTVYKNLPRQGNKTLLRAQKNNKAQLFYQDGTVASSEYDTIRAFSEGYAAFRDEDRYGFLDASGKEAIPAFYHQVSDFSQKHSRVLFREKYGLMNTEGHEVIPTVYEYLGDIQEDLLIAKKNDRYGLINLKNELVLPFHYDEIGRFFEGLARIRKGNLYGYVNKSGTLTIPYMFTQANSFQTEKPMFP